MKELEVISKRKVKSVPTKHKRYLFDKIDLNNKLILLLGHRGVGKTTMLIQCLKADREKSIYLSLDHLYFEGNRLINLINELYADGYKNFYLDEIHRYKNWSKDLKNIYDQFDDVKVIATGSSILEIAKGQSDLSRRAVVYNLFGLSFREFIAFSEGKTFNTYSFEDIIHNHGVIASEIYDQIDVLQLFNKYLVFGYYPFFNEGIDLYPQKLRETTNLIIDLDILSYEELQYSTVRNLKKLLYIVSQSVPFTPNVSKLAEKLELSRNTLLKMFDLLDRANVLNLLKSETKGVSFLQKPEKIYLQNTNLAYVLSENQPEVGNLRETFFLNQLQVNHDVSFSKYTDFLIDKQYSFEIGGPNKTPKQIRGLSDSFLAIDGIKGGAGRRIPLWMFGFMY